MAKGAIIARILSEYDAKGTKAASKDLGELEKHFGEFGKKAKEAFGLAAAASAGLAVAFGVDAVKAAMGEQQAMAVLNNTLHNTVGANEAVMTSTEAYIKQAALRYNFTTDQLIPSLETLVVATKNVSQAEGLQKLAMDISVGRGKDLNAVSLALAKAYDGNFSALKRLGVPLSETIIKHHDFNAAVKELTASMGGNAAAAADTFAGRVGRIGIAFDIVKKTIGNAIIVALQPFLDKFMQFLPQIEKWLDQNAKKIAAFFITGISYGVAFAQVLFDVFSFVARNIKVFAELGAVIVAIWAGTKVASGISSFLTGVNTIIKVFKALRSAAIGASLAEGIATDGASIAAGIAAAAAGLVAINILMDKFDKNAAKNANSMGGIKFNFKGLTTTADDYLKGLTKVNGATATNSNLTALQIKLLAELKKMGIVPTSVNDPIELEAARLNLLKQGNIEQQAKVQALIDATNAQIDANTATMRYSDILTVLADQHISSEEISVLAAKWGVSQDAVIAYVAEVTGAAAFDPTELGSAGAVAKQGWTSASAELNQYFDALGVLSDHHISAEEVVALSVKWGVSQDAVIAYLAKLTGAAAFDPKDLGSPGAVAADGWKNALDSLNKYYDGLANPPAVSTVTGQSKTGSTQDATQAAADAAQAAADAAAALTANFPDPNNPLGLEPSELSASRRAKDAALQRALASSMNDNGLTSSTSPDAGYASSLSTANFGASGLVNSGAISASAGGNNASGTGNTTIIVQGNVQTKSDTVASIRQDLLAGQLSGKPVSFSIAAL